MSYLQFVFKAQDKLVFDVKKIDTGALAGSFGLGNAPMIKFRKNEEAEEEEED